MTKKFTPILNTSPSRYIGMGGSFLLYFSNGISSSIQNMERVISASFDGGGSFGGGGGGVCVGG